MVISAGTRRQYTFFEEKVGIFGFDFSSLCLFIDGSACQLMQLSLQNQNKFEFLSENIIIFKKRVSKVISPRPEVWSFQFVSEKSEFCRITVCWTGQKSSRRRQIQTLQYQSLDQILHISIKIVAPRPHKLSKIP